MFVKYSKPMTRGRLSCRVNFCPVITGFNCFLSGITKRMRPIKMSSSWINSMLVGTVDVALWDI